jgi:hypothetical protein
MPFTLRNLREDLADVGSNWPDPIVSVRLV